MKNKLKVNKIIKKYPKDVKHTTNIYHDSTKLMKYERF